MVKTNDLSFRPNRYLGIMSSVSRGKLLSLLREQAQESIPHSEEGGPSGAGYRKCILMCTIFLSNSWQCCFRGIAHD